MAYSIDYTAGDAARVAETHRGQVKTRQRVRELAEVYTHEREVNAMLDLVPDTFVDIDSRYLEPSCGSGNFAVEILARKLRLVRSADASSQSAYEFGLLRALASLYAIDISAENVAEAHDRLTHTVYEHYLLDANTWVPSKGFESAVEEILRTNVICADTLNDARSITFIQYRRGPRHSFIRTISPFVEPELDLFYLPPEPLPPVHYSKLVKEHVGESRL